MATSKAPAKKASGGGRTTAKGTKPAARKAASTVPAPVLQQLTAEQLKTIQLAEATIPIPELGGSVQIRQFNGATAKLAREYATNNDDGSIDEDKFEVACVAYGMVNPELSLEEVEQLYEAQAAGAMRRIAMAVISLNATGQAEAISKLFG